MCIHTPWLATHSSANYPMRCSSGYRKHPSWWSAACEMVFRSSFRLFLCLTFALFSSLFPPSIPPPLPCEIAHLDESQMAQHAPKRAPTPTSHLAAMPPLPVCRKQSTSFCHPPVRLFWQPLFFYRPLSFRLTGGNSDTAMFSQPGSIPRIP